MKIISENNILKQIHSYMKLKYHKKVDYPAHIHKDIELIYVKKGGCQAFCDGQKYELSDNTFFLVAPYQVHHFIESITGEYITLVVNPKFLFQYSETFTSTIPQYAAYTIKDDDDYDIANILELCVKEFVKNGYNGIVGGLLTAFFGKLINKYTFEKSNVRSETTLQILEYCLSNYRKNISINDIAEHLYISRSTVSHIFSNRFAMNFCNYINSLRVFDAAELLKNSELSITDIATTTGFSNIRTFNRVFLKHYGMPPKAYRKQNLKI